MQFFLQDPNAKLDYAVEWADSAGWAAGDTIATSTWTGPTGLTLEDDSATATRAIVWVSGGTAGTRYTVTNHVVTAGGRKNDASIVLWIVDR